MLYSVPVYQRCSYLRQNGYKTIDDIIERQNEIPTEIRGNIYAYIMFGME